MNSYSEIHKCRISDSKNLISILNLGHLELTGVFPKTELQPVTRGPLELVWCSDSELLQLKHSYNAHEMYGENYGYRSGLNQSMVQHLSNKVKQLESLVALKAGDVVLDIGSNDATTLKAYSTIGLNKIGIDPVGKKFLVYYPNDVRLVPDFFSLKCYRSIERQPAKIITSIAMFYDLENPIAFAQEIHDVLADDGVWHFEQSYMPSMLRMNSYDTICHEHIEYYSLKVVKKILEAVNLKIVDVVVNSINGGSFAITATRKTNYSICVNTTIINWLLEQEDKIGLNTVRPYRDFELRVLQHRDDLTRLIRGLNADKKTVLGYGASTKGNVILQFCGLSNKDIPVIADVNPDKFGCVTPGTHIPIVSENEAHKLNPDYFLVLPWHFKDGILKREKKYLANGGRMIFPFPEIQIV